MAKFALLVGVSEYESSFTHLPRAAKDISSLEKVLKDTEIGDFPESNITVLSNPQKTEFELSVYNLFSNRKKEDLLLFYFSGYGITAQFGDFYFSTCSTRKENGRLVSPTAVSAEFVHKSMERSSSQHQVIILDCCFSAAFARGMSAKDASEFNVLNQLGGRGRAVLTACSSIGYSFEDEGFELSLYTHFLIEALEKGAADLDNDGNISVEELYEYINRKVRETRPDMSPDFYPVREGHKIFLAKSKKDEPEVKYRKEVERKVEQGNGEILFVARRYLDFVRSDLNISEVEA